MITNKTDLYHRLKLRHFGVLQKIEIVKYVWNIQLEWKPNLDQQEHYSYLNKLLEYYNNHFFRDISIYGRPMSDYDNELSTSLESIRLEYMGELNLEDEMILQDFKAA